MAQLKINNITGGNPDTIYEFIVREEFETQGNRALSFNTANSILLFDEIQDGQLHNYKITMRADGCVPATHTIAFKCTDTGACETVVGGEISGPSKIAINQPTPYFASSLAGTTPYTYAWVSSGGTISSTTTSSTTITFGQVGSYTLTATVTNCGNSPIVLTKTIEVVLETCDKSTNLCYFYGSSSGTPFPSFAFAYETACVGATELKLGSFSNGLNLGSTVYANNEPGSCTKLLPGYYALSSSSNGCNTTSTPGSVINSIIQVDISGKIIGLQNFSCDVSFDIASITQPICSGNTLTEALVTLNNIKNANRYNICEGSTFNCTTTVPDGILNSSSAVISVDPAPSGQNKVYSIRVYSDTNPSKYLDKTFIISSPTGCATKPSVPVIARAFYHPTGVGNNYITTFEGSHSCLGMIKLYKYNPDTKNYTMIYSGDTENITWQITPPAQNFNGPGEIFVATSTCNGVESDPSAQVVSVLTENV